MNQKSNEKTEGSVTKIPDEKKNNTVSGSNQQTAQSKNQIYDTLKDKRTFNHMPSTMLNKLIDVMRPQRFRKGQVILKQGDSSQSVYIILKGKVSVRVNGRLIYLLVRIGDVFGEISFLNNVPCTATIAVEDESIVLAISGQTLQKIGDTEFYIWLCRVIAEKLERTSKMVKNDK